jgi:hypothetical protein
MSCIHFNSNIKYACACVCVCVLVLVLVLVFQDAVLDLKGVELPVKMMLSSGRDGIIKLWR